MEHIVVTGVNTGIGLAITHYFLEKGYVVFGSVRQEKEAKQLKMQLGERFEPLVFDVRDDIAIQAAAQKVSKQTGNQGISLLVNNAGVVVSGPLKHLPTADIALQFDINVMGVHRVTSAFLPLLGADLNTTIEQKGMIINISSISAMVTSPFLGPYSASKIALEYLTDALRRELSIYPIRVAIVQPGPVKTPIWAKATAKIRAYSYHDTDYAPIFATAASASNSSEATAITPAKVAALVYRVFKTDKPRTRYIIGYNYLKIKLLSLFPPRWLDYLMTRKLKEKIVSAK